MAINLKSNEILGIFLVLVLLGGQSGSRRSAGPIHFSGLGERIPIEHFSRDMHRIVEMMDQVSNLGQLALKPPPRSHISGAADSVSQAVSSVSLPDMQQIMEMAGPIMSMLGGQNK